MPTSRMVTGSSDELGGPNSQLHLRENMKLSLRFQWGRGTNQKNLLGEGIKTS